MRIPGLPEFRMRLFLVFALLCLAVPARAEERWSKALPRPVDLAELPDGFSESVVATGLDGATALAVAPDGRVFVCEQAGALRVVRDDRLLPEPFVTLPVDSF